MINCWAKKLSIAPLHVAYHNSILCVIVVLQGSAGVPAGYKPAKAVGE